MTGFLVVLLNTFKKKSYLFIYPLIYLITGGLVIIFKFRELGFGAEIDLYTVFKIIFLIPSLFWTALILFYLFAHSGRNIFPKMKKPATVFSEAAPFSRYLKAIFNLLGFGLMLGGILIFTWIFRPYAILLMNSSKISALEQKADQGVSGNTIIIPSLLIEAPVLSGLNEKNLTQGVCLLTEKPAPGTSRNTIIEGHNLAEFGTWNSQGFFSLLELAKKGTKIYLFRSGKKKTYIVDSKHYLDVGDPSITEPLEKERLTLVTCVSTWSTDIYTNRRTVVFAYPVTD